MRSTACDLGAQATAMGSAVALAIWPSWGMEISPSWPCRGVAWLATVRGAVSTPLYATDRAVAALAEARPQLVDVLPAAELVPHLANGGACHAGPPIASVDMCAPMRAALGVALTLEGVAG